MAVRILKTKNNFEGEKEENRTVTAEDEKKNMRCHDSLRRMKFPQCPLRFLFTQRWHSQALCGLVLLCVLCIYS